MTVIENKIIIIKAIMNIDVSFKAGVLIIRTSSICPESNRLKKMPNNIPFIIEITILIRISKYIISLRSKTEMPIDLNILKTSASYLHFPYV